jgi:hypothetical protein
MYLTRIDHTSDLHEVILSDRRERKNAVGKTTATVLSSRAITCGTFAKQ